MAEFLVKAKAHWMDSLKQRQVNQLTPEAKAIYDARTQIGDIIVVRPDGHVWGSAENLPDFIVIKCPQILYEDVKDKTDILYSNDPQPKMLKRRKWRVPQAWVQNYVDLNQSVIELTLNQNKLDFINNLIEKTS